MSLIDIYTASVAYDDLSTSSNPVMRDWSWTRRLQQIQINNPRSDTFQILPSQSLSVFSGVRTLLLDGTTTFSVALNPLYNSVYRFNWTGGTNPGLRINRNLALNTEAVTISINNNITAVFSVPFGSVNNFTGVQIGDNLWIPPAGDPQLPALNSTPFNVNNYGLWVVIAVGAGGLSVTAMRIPGTAFSGANETETITNNAQIQAFSSGGIQIGDKLQISAGFSSVSFGTYIITNVNPSWIESTLSSPIPLDVGVTPGVAGFVVYSSFKRFVRVESDNPCALQFNGDITQNNRIDPLSIGDLLNNPAYFEKLGSAWSLNVVNLSPINTVTVKIWSYE